MEEIRNKLKLLLDLKRKIADGDVYSKNKCNPIQEEYYLLEEQIIKSFGLKPTFDVLWVFGEMNFWEQSAVDNAYTQLCKVSEGYLLSSPATTNKLIKNYINGSIECSEFLCELNLPIHVYTIFLAEQLLKKSIISKNTFFKNVNAANNPQMLNKLGRLVFSNSNPPNLFTGLEFEKDGVSFVNEFYLYTKSKEYGK